MKRIPGSIIAFVLSSVFAVATTNAQTQNPETGHYYEVVASGPITWDAANTAAMAAGCLGPDGMSISCMDADAVQPHLATITSAREELFVDDLRDSEVSGGGGGPGQTWIGGIQDGPGGEPFNGWRWVNSEGNFDGMNGGTVYTNWATNEPNESGSEDHLTLGRYGLGLGWNDEAQNRGSIEGYIIEWDVPLPAEDCVPSPANPEGCTTVVGQTISIPAAAIPPGTTPGITFNSFEFNDPRVNPVTGVCDNTQLTIFGNSGIGAAPGVQPAMVIPGYLCGSPKFLVVAIDSGDLEIESGSVGVVNDTFTVLPGNFYPEFGGNEFGSVCNNVIPQNFPLTGDPQYEDVSIWQDTEEPTKMLEATSGIGGILAGSTGEYTNECGTSRMRVRGASYFGIGFRIDFGAGNTWAGNTAGNFDSFVQLTRYKLTLLLQSVLDARADMNDAGKRGIARKGDFRKMRNAVKNAIKNLDKGKYWSASRHIRNFNKFAGRAKYSIIDGENYEGEHIMRGTNLEFTMKTKILPYAP